jgi:hypothetical protein
MARVGRLVIGAVMVAGLLGGVLAGAAGTVQAQAMPSSGVVGGSGLYTATGQSMPVNTVTVAQFPAAGLNPPYNPDTVGVPASIDITILRGRADFSPPQAGQFPVAFMTQSMPSPISR